MRLAQAGGTHPTGMPSRVIMRSLPGADPGASVGMILGAGNANIRRFRQLFEAKKGLDLKKKKTRMHSSRIHTVCCSGCRGGGNFCLGAVCPKGVYWGVYTSHTKKQTCPLPTQRQMPPRPRVRHPQPPPRPLWTEFLTHTCENIIFPQLLLQTVKIRNCGTAWEGGGRGQGEAGGGGRSPTMIITQTRTSAVLEDCSHRATANAKSRSQAEQFLFVFHDLLGQNKT